MMTQVAISGQGANLVVAGGADDVARYIGFVIAVIGNGGSAAIASHVVTDLVR
jgi:hypothetical protein